MELGAFPFAFILLLTRNCMGFLNIEELNEAKYALDILNKPLNEIELNPTEGLKLASRHGQNYYCKLPPAAIKPPDKDEETIPKTTPIANLLEPMREDSCLKTIKGWWTYEFCYGKYITQYHSEDDAPPSDVTYLGYYESDFDWNEEVLSDSQKFKRHKFNRYHSQSYVNGTACDIINHKRDTEIRYICDDSSAETYIERVDEPSTCSYILTIHTPYVCSHPHTKPLRNPKPVSIVCQPILTAEDYTKFTEMEEVTAKKGSDPKLQLSSGPGEDFASPHKIMDLFKNMFAHSAKKEKEEKQRAKEKNEKKGDELQRLEQEAEAVKMIERFIVKERLQKIDPFKQKLLLMNVVDLLKRYQHLPTADRARAIEKYVSDFVSAFENHSQSQSDLQEYQDKMTDALANDFINEVNEYMQNSDKNKDEKEKSKQKQSPAVRLKLHTISSVDDIPTSSEDLMKEEPDEKEYNPIWKKLEDDIGKGLEEAGFETEGGQVEIRIISSSGNLEEIIPFSDEEGTRFKLMLVELVAGDAAMNKEIKKQKELHNNYNLVWKKEDSGFASLSTFEEDNNNDDKVDRMVRSPKL